MDSGVSSFIHNTAKVCSPVVDTTTLDDHLEPRTSPGTNSTLLFHGGKLVDGSQGILLLNIANMSPANLQRLHNYTRDSTSFPKNKTFVSPPQMPNTATCWMLADTETVLRPKETAMETLHVATGGLVLPHVDLLLKAGRADVHEDLAMDSILGIPAAAFTSCCESAAAQLRGHLLKSCAMDPPVMYAVSTVSTAYLC